MNRTRQQTKAAKARKDWERLQEQILKEEEVSEMPNWKKVKSTRKEVSLRDIA